jgi:hypothetical protein
MNWNSDNSVAQTFQSAGSRDFLVPCSEDLGTGDWKPNVGLRVARTHRLESLRYDPVYEEVPRLTLFGFLGKTLGQALFGPN